MRQTVCEVIWRCNTVKRLMVSALDSESSLSKTTCRTCTGLICLRILGESEAKSAKKITPVRIIPLFTLFRRSNMIAATQIVILHHVILECSPRVQIQHRPLQKRERTGKRFVEKLRYSNERSTKLRVYQE